MHLYSSLHVHTPVQRFRLYTWCVVSTGVAYSVFFDCFDDIFHVDAPLHHFVSSLKRAQSSYGSAIQSGKIIHTCKHQAYFYEELVKNIGGGEGLIQSWESDGPLKLVPRHRNCSTKFLMAQTGGADSLYASLRRPFYIAQVVLIQCMLRSGVPSI